MKRRSCVLGVIFTIITLGLYGLYWFCRLTDDTNKLAAARKSMATKTAMGIVALLFTIITLGIYIFYWYYKLGVKIDEIRGYPGSSGVLYLLLCVIGVAFIPFLLAQSEVNAAISRLSAPMTE